MAVFALLKVPENTIAITSLRRSAKHYGQALIPAAQKWWREKHADEAAALAFYSLISLVPLLLTSVYVASLVIDKETAKEIIIAETDSVAGTSVGQYIATMLHSEIQWAGSRFSPLLGAVLLTFSATKMVLELRSSLGKIFGARTKRKNIYSGLIGRLVAFLMVLGIGGVIICAVAVETIINLMMGLLSDQSLAFTLASYITPITSFLGVVFLASFTMRWLPENRPKLREAIAGGAICAILLAILKMLITQTIKHTDIGSYFGSAFTLVLVLFWVYFTMQVFLFGAEYAAALGRRSQQKKEDVNAEPAPVPQKRDPFLS